jgi:phosphoglycolate phosphatase
VRGFVGNGIAKLMERAVGEEVCQRQDFENILSAFKEYYKAHCADATKPYAGILELLYTLKNRGLKTAVLSNKADFAVKMLAKEYFGDLLQEAVGENEAAGIRKKPAPDSLYAVMEGLKADKKSTVYIGDSEVDIQTANNAGVDCISVTWGFKDETFLKENGAKTLVNTPMEILDFCKK